MTPLFDGPPTYPRDEQGRCWLVRYRDPAGDQRSKSFHRKRDAEAYAASVTTDMAHRQLRRHDSGEDHRRRVDQPVAAALGHLKESSGVSTVGHHPCHVRSRWGGRRWSGSCAWRQTWVSDLGSTLGADERPRNPAARHGDSSSGPSWGIRECRSFAPEGGSDVDAARRLEVFLDLVAHEATEDASFLLDDRYAPLLGDADVALSRALDPVQGRTRGHGSAARRVRLLLARTRSRENARASRPCLKAPARLQRPTGVG